MNRIKTLLVILILLPLTGSTQSGNIMVSYGQSKFIFAPGVEINYFVYKKLGIQLGVSSYFLDYQPDKIANQLIKNNYYGYFNNLNLGLCGVITSYKNLKLGWTAGWKMYYGPKFQPLYFYESEGYYIYFDSSGKKFDHGIDLGVLLYTKKHVLGLKYDTAREQIRWLAGWSF